MNHLPTSNFVFSTIGKIHGTTKHLLSGNRELVRLPRNHSFCNKKKEVIDFFKFYILSVAFVFYISPYTSPSNPYYNCDSSAFYLIGKAMQHGMMLYKDIFDHKGPLLFYIYAWGEWLIPGKTGLFFLQTINMSVILLLIHKLARLFTSARTSALLLIFSMLCLSAFISEGGLTEEWSLSLSLIVLYTVFKHLLSHPASSLPSGTWVLLGVTFSCHCLMRINNSATVCGLILALSLILLSERHILSLVRGWALFSVSAAIPVAIFTIYMWKMGIFHDYIYSNFYFNAIYAMNGATSKSISVYANIFIRLASLPVMLLVGSILLKRGSINGNVMICMFSVAIISVIALIPGNNYPHYYMIYIPTILCSLIIFSKFISERCPSRKTKSFFLIFFLSLFTSFIYLGIISVLRGAIITFFRGHPTEKQQLLDSCKRFKDIISQNGGGSFIAYDSEGAYETGPEVYLYTGMLPCHKYFFAQSFHSRIDPNISESLDGCFTGNNPPKWVVIRHSSLDINTELASLKSKTVETYLRDRCERVAYGKRRPGKNDRAYSLYCRTK